MFVLGWLGFWFLLYTRSRQAKRPSQCQMAEHTLRLPWVLRAGQCPDTGCLARRSAGLVRYPRGSHSRTDNALFEPPRHPATTGQRPPPLRPLISPQASLGGGSIISMAVADSRHKPPHQHAASHARYATGLTGAGVEQTFAKEAASRRRRPTALSRRGPRSSARQKTRAARPEGPPQVLLSRWASPMRPTGGPCKLDLRPPLAGIPLGKRGRGANTPAPGTRAGEGQAPCATLECCVGSSKGHGRGAGRGKMIK